MTFTSQPTITSDYRPTPAAVNTIQCGEVTMHYLDDPNCEICKIEWVFNAGTANQNKSLQANFTINLMLEGTPNYNSKQFAQKLDELGAYFGVECGKDFCSFTLHVLSSNLQESLDLIYPIFSEPLMEQKEFDHLLHESKQEFEQNLHDPGFLARQKLRKELHHNHPYGKLASKESYEHITLVDITQYADKHILKTKHEIYLSGKVNTEVLNAVQNKITESGKLKLQEVLPVIPVSPRRGLFSIHHENAKQDSVRLGINIPNHHHNDFLTLNLINTILGGYFGSRLMQNIREEKGWTYGVNSSITPGKQLCFLTIGTDVLQEKGERCIFEVKKELKKIQEKAINTKELQKVSAYISGNLLRSFDGTFQQMDRFQSTHIFGMTTAHYIHYMKFLKEVSPAQIQEAANKHLNLESFTEVLVSSSNQI